MSIVVVVFVRSAKLSTVTMIQACVRPTICAAWRRNARPLHYRRSNAVCQAAMPIMVAGEMVATSTPAAGLVAVSFVRVSILYS